MLGNGDDVDEAHRRVNQLNDFIKKDVFQSEMQEMKNTFDQKIQELTNALINHKLEMEAINTKTQENVQNEDLIKKEVFQTEMSNVQSEIKEMKNTFEQKMSELTNALTNVKLELEAINTKTQENEISEEIKKLNINMGHALKLDIQNNETRLKDAFEKMETNIKFSNKLMSEMVNKQLQFKTNVVTNKILEMVANNIKSQEEYVISDEELVNFYESKEYVDYISYEGRQPIHAACFFGRLDVVKRMINNGIDVNIKDEENMTPLMWAAWKNQKEIVEYLISKNVDLNIRSTDGVDKTALSFARFFKYKEIVEILLKHGATE